MTQIEKLMTLREKLVARRRVLVEGSLSATAQQLTGETFAKVQSAIDAVDRAIEDERRQQSSAQESTSRQRVGAP